MSISKNFTIRTLTLFAAALFCVTPPTVQAEEYCAALRMPAWGSFVLIPFEDNLGLHKEFDATIRYVEAIDEVGAPIRYAEEGIGISVDVTDFTRDGDTFHFNISVVSRQITGWQPLGGAYQPIFQTKTFRTTSDSGPISMPYGGSIELIPDDAENSGIPTMRIAKIEFFTPE